MKPETFDRARDKARIDELETENRRLREALEKCDPRVGSENGAELIGTEALRKLKKHSYQNSYGCWVWRGGTGSKGYGVVWCAHRGKLVQAHRLAWEIVNGAIPEGQVVRHLCDNPRCVNPDHMDIGTQAQNVADIPRANPRVDMDGNALPVGVYQKGGSYYLVRKNKWIRLGRHFDEAMDHLQSLEGLSNLETDPNRINHLHGIKIITD